MINAFSLLILFVLVFGVAGAILGLSTLVGRRRVGEECLVPYECGLDPIGEPRRRFSVQFFLIATIFIIFEVEILFFYPWALVFREGIDQGKGLFLFGEILLFTLILVLGLAYVWRSGALDWEEK
jgi:NADH-quinone oxidoreductase subunit A